SSAHLIGIVGHQLDGLRPMEPAGRHGPGIVGITTGTRTVGTSLSTTAPETAVQSAPAKVRPDRLDSIDMLRGVVMVIMALDHVRDFWSDRFFREDPTDLTKTTAAIFLTRWITHYCAPTFIFLAGTGAFLSGTRGKSKPELSWFL